MIICTASLPKIRISMYTCIHVRFASKHFFLFFSFFSLHSSEHIIANNSQERKSTDTYGPMGYTWHKSYIPEAFFQRSETGSLTYIGLLFIVARKKPREMRFPEWGEDQRGFFPQYFIYRYIYMYLCAPSFFYKSGVKTCFSIMLRGLKDFFLIQFFLSCNFFFFCYSQFFFPFFFFSYSVLCNEGWESFGFFFYFLFLFLNGITWCNILINLIAPSLRGLRVA